MHTDPTRRAATGHTGTTPRATGRPGRSRWTAILTIVALIAAGLTLGNMVFAAPASAGATNCDWGSGYVCLYKNSSYATGGIARYAGSDRDYTNNTFDHCWWNCGLNDNVSSIKNRGNHMNTAHYKHKNYRGYMLHVRRGHQRDLYGNSANDELSSHRWVRW